MLKRVTYGNYMLLKSMYNITIIAANDTEAVIIIH